MNMPKTEGGTGEPKLDPVAREILELLGARGAGKSVCPADVAVAFAERQWKPVSPPPGEWRQYLTAVRQQALYLARAGRVLILRKGKPLDPDEPVKGVVRLALPR